MEFFSEFIMPVVLGVCLCIGYVIKKWLNDVDDKYIPTIVAFLGVFVASWIHGWQITPEIVLTGLCSGLASTGMHQLFKQYLAGKNT
ncbi:MAG: holin [Lachnospiraceae bacterium]|nr:holin [Lachnospiraceae bacterium]